jgi:hypothetical protein
VEANKAFNEMMQSYPGENKDKLFGDLFRQKDYREKLLKKVLSGKEYQEEIYLREFDKYLKILFFTHRRILLPLLCRTLPMKKRN